MEIKNKIQAVKVHIESFFQQKDLYLPLHEAVLLLRKKGTPVFFFNRVGFIKDYPYPKEAQRRIDKKLSFPKMYSDPQKHEHEFREIFGEKFSWDYVDRIGRIPQVIKKSDKYCHEDCKSQYINVINGKRITVNQPTDFKRTIHIYGRCGVFGYAVEDADTMPSQMQKYFLDHGMEDVRVVNHGLWGGADYFIEHNFLEESLGFGQEDIVVFYIRRFRKKIMKDLMDLGMYYRDLTEDWHNMLEPVNCIYDKPGHMGAKGYESVATLIATDLIQQNFGSYKVNATDSAIETPHLTEYLKAHINTGFENEIKCYTDEILKNYPLEGDNCFCGAIVMNCNPFTKGHRYLIETVSKKVDRLYIFVVEEDKSFFRFADRFEMVQQGTKDLKNVVVIPSGRYVISAYTFPEYFMKDYVKEKAFDVSGDIEVFCKYIAPALSIKIRFAGEEPLDPVTKKYNEIMKQMLPDYGMKFCEIARFELDNGKVINATEVRRLLKEKLFDEMKEYLPLTTFDILMKKYTD